MKFDDFFITPILSKINSEDKQNYVNVFVYEKTYLFISHKPLCRLFHVVLQNLINVKKINFLHNMSDFSSIFIKSKYNEFLQENSEKNGRQINEILNFAYNKRWPLFQETIYFKSELNNIHFEYTYPNPFNKMFLAVDWLAENFLYLLDYDTFFNILIRVLLESSFIFISDNIQILTATVLGFSYLIKPFKWPFIFIPNLPVDLMNMMESPVPYLIGVLGNDNLKNELQRNTLISHCEFVEITEKKIDFQVKKV